MKGFPKYIATRQDIEQLMAFMGTPLATPENLQRGHAFLTGLLDTQYYVFDRVLGATEAPDGSEPQYRVLANQGPNEDERHQFILTANPRARLHQMGLTVSQVQGWISDLEGVM